MADYHVNHNGWGGIGVHFVCTEDGYPGKPQFGLPAGAHVQYVGDLLTWRAGVANNNPGVVHIEISGLFTPGNGVPSEAQLRAVRKLIDFLLAPNNLLPSLNFYNQVTYHNAIATPGNGTECPGWQHPQFAEWFGYLQGGAEPSWWTPAPQPTPATPETPVQADPVPGMGGGDVPIPEYEATYKTQTEVRAISRPGANALDVTTGRVVVETIPEGQQVDIAGYFDFNGLTYARSVYAASKGLWNGVNTVYFETPTGQPSGPVPVTVVPKDPTAVAENVTDSELQEATVPDSKRVGLLTLIKEVFGWLVAKIVKKRI